MKAWFWPVGMDLPRRAIWVDKCAGYFSGLHRRLLVAHIMTLPYASNLYDIFISSTNEKNHDEYARKVLQRLTIRHWCYSASMGGVS